MKCNTLIRMDNHRPHFLGRGPPLKLDQERRFQNLVSSEYPFRNRSLISLVRSDHFSISLVSSTEKKIFYLQNKKIFAEREEKRTTRPYKKKPKNIFQLDTIRRISQKWRNKFFYIILM